MRFLQFLLLFVVCIFARTPLDTLAVQRTDSGSAYIKIHPVTWSSYALYRRYTPDTLRATVATELLDTLKGLGTTSAMDFTPRTRYVLDVNMFSGSSTTWSYSFSFVNATGDSTITIFTNTESGASAQARHVEVYRDSISDKMFLARSVRQGQTIATTIDSANFSAWNTHKRVSWKVTPGAKVRLIGVRMFEEK